MLNKISLGLGVALVLVASANAASSYKVTKVGSEEEQSFELLYNSKVVSEASPGAWLYVSPIVPDGKMFKSFTVYDEYGETADEQKVSTAAVKELRFLMPNHDVYVKAYYESLRFYINANESKNGTISFSFSDRLDVKDRTKPGFKVTVTPKADAGYKIGSIVVSKYLDPKTTVVCGKAEATVGGIGGGMWPGVGVTTTEGSCVFEMPEFDVDITATFVEEATVVPEVNLKDKKFNVTYELYGGVLPEGAAKSFVCDSMAKLPTPTKEGYDFVGWSLDKKLDNVYHALKTLNGNACTDTTVYAVWTASGTCPEQEAIVVDTVARMPVCTERIKCALIHVNADKQDSVCNGVAWLSDLSMLPSSSSAAPASSSSAVASSSSATPASSSTVASSSSATPASSSVKASSSSAKAASSSSVKASSSSAKAASSSSKKASSSSSETVVESVETEEDLPNCTSSRENVTYYVSKLKKVFVCKDRKWNVFDPSGIPTIAIKPSFAVMTNGRQLQVSGAKVGSQVSLFDMQGRVMYNGKADASNFSLNVVRSGTFLLRVGSQQKVVEIR